MTDKDKTCSGFGVEKNAAKLTYHEGVSIISRAAGQLVRAKQAATGINLDGKWPPGFPAEGGILPDRAPVMIAVDIRQWEAMCAVVKIVQEEI